MFAGIKLVKSCDLAIFVFHAITKICQTTGLFSKILVLLQHELLSKNADSDTWDMNKKIISSAPDKPCVYFTKVLGTLGIALSLAKSEIRGRAAQTTLKYFINLLQILLATALYWFIFGYVFKLETGKIPFPLFVLTGMVPWSYFSGLIQEAGSSLINSRHLISKIYFPRVILPISKTLIGLIDFFIAIMIAIFIVILWKMPLRIEILMIPVFLIILVFSGTAIGLWIASMSVKFRDLSRIIPHLVSFGFFMTPVFYPTTIIPDKIEFILYINPAAYAIEGFRWAIFGSEFPSLLYTISLVPMVLLFIWGWSNFRKKEKYYADII